MPQDISRMTIQELKAMAYDLSLQAAQLQTDLQTINGRIAYLAKKAIDADTETDEKTVE